MMLKKGRRRPQARAGADEALLEKYCHSRAAMLYAEGYFARAIRFFRKSLRLADQPAIRCDLALTYLAKGDADKALAEIDRAITLAPDVAEYYHVRSGIWRAKGDRAKGDVDERAAVRLDANYRRIARIRASAEALQRAFYDEDFPLPEPGGIANPGLRMLVEAAGARRAEQQALQEKSCVVPCPAYCCHFPHDPVVHGVWFGGWKLRVVREWLKEKGYREERFIGRLPFCRKKHFTRLIPPHVVMRQAGRDIVFHPGRARVRLGKSLMKDAPKGKDYQNVTWFTADARACAFLSEGRCMIHDLGGEPSLPACKEFLCLTGLVFLVLEHLGVISAADLKGRPLGVLNRAALEAMLLLADRIYGDPAALSAMRNAARQTLQSAVEADAAGRPANDVNGLVDRYRQQEHAYMERLSAEKASLAAEIRNLLAPEKA